VPAQSATISASRAIRRIAAIVTEWEHREFFDLSWSADGDPADGRG
jgi:hypothetical protein